MPGFFGTVKTTGRLQRMIGRKTESLIQQEYAVKTAARDFDSFAARRVHSSRGFLSDSTASSISLESRAPS